MWVELLIAGYIVPLSRVGDVVWVEDPEEAERVLENGIGKRATKAQVQRHLEGLAGGPMPEEEEEKEPTLETQGGGGPLPEEDPVETAPDHQDLERLTKAELQELAAERGLDLDPDHMTKAEMIAAIEALESEGGE